MKSHSILQNLFYRSLIILLILGVLCLLSIQSSASTYGNIDSPLAVIEVCGDITTSATWIPGNIYVFTCDVTIKPGATLTIEPSVIIKGRTDHSLIVEGKLTAVGTESNPIYFTSDKDDSLGGDTNGDGTATVPGTGGWGSILFKSESSPDSIMEHVELRYGGRERFWDVAPIFFYASASPTIKSITFYKNYLNGIELQGDRTWLTDTWDNVGVPYILRNDVTVAERNTLTIAPGLVIKSTTDHSLIIRGKLIAQGTPALPIKVTTLTEDIINDTNNDGTASSPATGGWGSILFMPESDPDSIIQHVELRYGGRERFWDVAPIFLYATAYPTIKDITFFKNHLNAIELQGGVNWLTTTWSNTGISHVFREDITIPERNTLTIAPGMVIQSTTDHSLIVRGKLVAEGLSDKLITITSLNEDFLNDANNDGTASSPATGGWGSILFMPESDPDSLIKYVELRYGGRERFWNVAPIFFYASVSPTVSNVRFHKNYFNGIELQGGVDWLSTIWHNAGIPYVFLEDITIPERNTLIIKPGVIIKSVVDQSLIVRGALQANGTTNSPIYFTSLYDDETGGDTNNDGRASGPSPKQWGSIYFANSSDDVNSVVSHVVIQYSGRERFRDTGAVYLESASPKLQNNRIVSNFRGVEAEGDSSPQLQCNDIYSNTTQGILNKSATTVIVAENQWWGSPSGPAHASNPGGTGQAVGDGVDFTPWATGSCVSDPEPTDTPTPTPTPTNTPTPCPTDTIAGPSGCATITPTFTHTPTPVSPTPTNTPITPTPVTPATTPVPTPTGTPTIREIRPNQGSADVANTINIYGTNFAQGAAVRLANTALTATYVSAGQLQAEVPAGLTPGTYALTVTNPNGAAATLADAYTVLSTESDDLTGYAYELWVEPAAPQAGVVAKAGLVVHRQGGKQVLPNVVVHIYVGDPMAGGTFVGAETIPLLSPRSTNTGPGVSWTPPTAGAYELYAVIDPSNTVAETNETNNVVHRTVEVIVPAADEVAPHVDSFTINNGATGTTAREVQLNTTAGDRAPGTVTALLFMEYEYSQGASQWTLANVSEWIDYATAHSDYPWTLLPSIGMHYLQVWAKDSAGNISLFPYTASITYSPTTQRVARDQVRIYRYTFAAGEQVMVRVQPNSGDPDLYVWAPDHATRPAWVSNLATGVDDVSFVAPVSGVYQVEVYGYSAAEYQLVVDHGIALVVATENTGGVDPNKSQPSQPHIPLNNQPSTKVAVPPAGQTVQSLYLPLIQR